MSRPTRELPGSPGGAYGDGWSAGAGVGGSDAWSPGFGVGVDAYPGGDKVIDD